jgi:hypothetical protein
VAYAAQRLPAGSVGAKQLRRAAVTRSKIAPGAVDGAKVAPQSLTGTQINLATLGTVPRAAIATTAGAATSATNATQAATAGTATRLTSVTLVRTDGPALAPGHNESVDSFCASGGQPIGGGGRADASNADDAIVSSRPALPNTTLPGTGSTLQGWQVSVVNNSNTNIHPSAWVICAG